MCVHNVQYTKRRQKRFSACLVVVKVASPDEPLGEDLRVGLKIDDGAGGADVSAAGAVAGDGAEFPVLIIIITIIII